MPLTVNHSCFYIIAFSFSSHFIHRPNPQSPPRPCWTFTEKNVFSITWEENNAVWEYGTAPRRWRGSGGLVRVKKKSSTPSPYAFYFKCSQTLWKHHHWHALSSPKHIYRPAQTLAPVRVPLQLKSPWALHARKAEKQQQQQSNVPVPKNIFKKRSA